MASMYYKYGSFRHRDGEVQPTAFDRVNNFNERGVATTSTCTIQLSGIIIPTAAEVTTAGSGAAAIDLRVRAIQSAYSLGGQSTGLILPSGQQSALWMDSGSSLYGVQVASGPSFPMERNAAHFATGLPYTITLKAEYAPFGGLALADAFIGSTETIEQIGNGGPIRRITILDNGLPVIDEVSPASPVIVTQSGEAAYELPSTLAPVYPQFGRMLFPDNLIPDSYRVTRNKVRSRQAGRQQYKATWSYAFQFTQPPFIPNPQA